MYVWRPTKDPKTGQRRYNKWAGNPKGYEEDLTRCAAEVSNGLSWGFVQCSRKRGHGPGGEYCKQHAKADNLRR